VTSKVFSVTLRDLEDGPSEISGGLTQPWVDELLHDTDVRHAQAGEGHLDLTVTKTGPNILVQGKMNLTVTVPCARTLEPALYVLSPKIFLHLFPAQGVEITPPRRPARGEHKSDKKTKSKAGNWSDDAELSDGNAAQDTYSGEEIVLDNFLREFILLEIPMIPLREDLRDVPFEANPPLPEDGSSRAETTTASAGESDEDFIDPRLLPLRDLKARLEKKE